MRIRTDPLEVKTLLNREQQPNSQGLENNMALENIMGDVGKPRRRESTEGRRRGGGGGAGARKLERKEGRREESAKATIEEYDSSLVCTGHYRFPASCTLSIPRSTLLRFKKFQ